MSSTHAGVVAIVYDFDGTLSEGNMQEYEFIPQLGMSVAEFWDSADSIAATNDADSVLSYMERMVSLARERGVHLSRECLREMGRGVKLFPGVDTWFDRINDYAATIGVEVRHYVNSSGLQEMIEGTPIAKHFHKIYASSFLYDSTGAAYWPAVAINYTNKTQFIFKINKGIESISDSKLVNEYVPHEDRPIPFSHIIFIGDGMTDVPSMRLVHSMGGYAVALYDPRHEARHNEMKKLIGDGRVNYLCEANYEQNSHLDQTIKSLLDTYKL